MFPYIRRLVVCVTCALLVHASSAFADPATLSALPYLIDSTVNALARSGNVVFLGGVTGFFPKANIAQSFMVFPPTEGVPLMATATPNGAVLATVADGAGGWYIGGNFTKVGGVTHAGLAHVLANGAVDPAFVAEVNGTVFALAFADGRLYIGGSLSTVNLVPRSNLAVVSAATGQVLLVVPTISGGNAIAYSLAVSGTMLYVGGSFTTAGGMARASAAAFIASTGAVTPWVANATGGSGAVNAVAVDGTSVYLGGSFASANGTARARVARVDATTGLLDTTWNPGADGDVETLQVAAGVVYIGGAFSVAGGQPRPNVAAIGTASGAATGWSPAPNAPVRRLTVDGGTVYLAGQFTRVGGEPRIVAAAVTTSAPATLLPWNPSPYGIVFDIASAAGRVAVVGDFKGWGFVERHGVLAIDMISGEALPWDPVVSGIVYELVVAGPRLYIAGTFTAVDGESRKSLAAFDIDSLQLLPFAPAFTGVVYAVAASGNTVYAGGDFSYVNGTFRGSLAALDAGTGQVLPWDPQADGRVGKLLAYGDRVVVGGQFTSLIGATGTNGFQTRYGLGVITAAGFVTPLNVTTGASNVVALAISGDILYFGGVPFVVPGHTGVAAANLTSGALLPWNPGADNSVQGLDILGGFVYMAGTFNNVGGQPRAKMAKVRASDGALSAWAPAVGALYAFRVVALGQGALFGAGFNNPLLGNANAVYFPEQALGGVPGPPTALDARTGGGAVSFSWNAPLIGAPPTTYRLEAGSGYGLSNIGTLPLASTTFATGGVPPGTYFVRVRAGNGAGFGLASPDIVLAVGSPTCTTPASPPVGLRSAVTSSTLILNWLAGLGSPPTSFTLLAGTSAGTSNLGVLPVGPSTTFTTTGVPPGVFFVRVLASNACGQRAPSTDTIVRVGGVAGPPGAPLQLTGTAIGGVVTLAWAPGGGGATSNYVLEAGPGPGLTIATVPLGAATGFAVGGVPGGTYFIRVRASNAAGISPPSGELILVMP